MESIFKLLELLLCIWRQQWEKWFSLQMPLFCVWLLTSSKKLLLMLSSISLKNCHNFLLFMCVRSWLCFFLYYNKVQFQVVNNSTVPFLGFVQDGALCMGFQDLGPWVFLIEKLMSSTYNNFFFSFFNYIHLECLGAKALENPRSVSQPSDAQIQSWCLTNAELFNWWKVPISICTELIFLRVVQGGEMFSTDYYVSKAS